MVGISNGGERGGGRSSGGCGVSAAACKQASCHASVAPRVVASATDARTGPFGHRGFAGDEPARRQLRYARGRRLRQTNEGGIRGKRTGGSPRSRRDARRSRGRPDGDESTAAILGGRGGERRSWRHPGLPAPSVLVRRKRGTRRGFLARRRGEGSTVAAAIGVGGGGSVRVRGAEREGEQEKGMSTGGS